MSSLLLSIMHVLATISYRFWLLNLLHYYKSYKLVWNRLTGSVNGKFVRSSINQLQGLCNKAEKKGGWGVFLESQKSLIFHVWGKIKKNKKSSRFGHKINHGYRLKKNKNNNNNLSWTSCFCFLRTIYSSLVE